MTGRLPPPKRGARKESAWERAVAALRSYLEAARGSPLIASVEEQRACWKNLGAIQPH